MGLAQQYLPTPVLGTTFYEPSDQGYEGQVQERLNRWRIAQAAALGLSPSTWIKEEHADHPADPPRGD
jgi:putative ATPase